MSHQMFCLYLDREEQDEMGNLACSRTTTYCVLWVKYGKRLSTSSCRATNENVSAETWGETKVGVTGKRIMDLMVSACTGESADSRSASALTLFTPRCVLFSLLMREWRQPGGKSETSVLYLPAVMCSWYKVCPQTSAFKTKSKCTQVSEKTELIRALHGVCVRDQIKVGRRVWDQIGRHTGGHFVPLLPE